VKGGLIDLEEQKTGQLGEDGFREKSSPAGSKRREYVIMKELLNNTAQKITFARLGLASIQPGEG
jgi:hypothetical protein